MNQSPIFARTYDLILWLIPHTIKFPRTQRFILGKQVNETTLAFQEALIDAAHSDAPLNFLKRADTQLQKLRFYLRLCRDLQLLTLGQYAHVSQMEAEVGRLLGGWLRKIARA
jgi:hypothetical protein